MPRPVSGPWFRAGKNTWYATLGGKAVSLGVRGKNRRAAALAAWAARSARTPEAPRQESTLATILDRFLNAKNSTARPKTVYVYRCLLANFRQTYGHLRPDQLDLPDVQAWLGKLDASPNTRHNVAGTVTAALRWARVQKLTAADPLAGLTRPPRTSRGAKAAVSEETHRRLVEDASKPLRELLTLLHLTGARPGEAARLTAADVDLENKVAVLAEHKTAHQTGRPRVIVLVEAASTLLRELAARNPEGPLLRNCAGTPWTKDAIVLAVRRCAKRAGVRATAYGYRHAYATAALAAGVPDAQVAALLGHSSTAVLHKHYAHLTSQVGVLRRAAESVRTASPSETHGHQ